MEVEKYVIRCRKNGILVTSDLEKHDVVWKRPFNPEVSSIDAKFLEEKQKQAAKQLTLFD